MFCDVSVQCTKTYHLLFIVVDILLFCVYFLISCIFSEQLFYHSLDVVTSTPKHGQPNLSPAGSDLNQSPDPDAPEEQVQDDSTESEGTPGLNVARKKIQSMNINEPEFTPIGARGVRTYAETPSFLESNLTQNFSASDIDNNNQPVPMLDLDQNIELESETATVSKTENIPSFVLQSPSGPKVTGKPNNSSAFRLTLSCSFKMLWRL